MKQIAIVDDVAYAPEQKASKPWSHYAEIIRVVAMGCLIRFFMNYWVFLVIFSIFIIGGPLFWQVLQDQAALDEWYKQHQAGGHSVYPYYKLVFISPKVDSQIYSTTSGFFAARYINRRYRAFIKSLQNPR